MATTGAMAISRVSVGVQGAFASRYYIVQVLYISILYVLSIKVFKKINSLVWLVILCISLVLYVLRTKASISGLENNKALRAKGLISYYVDAENNTLGYPKPQKAVKILDQSIEGGFYNPPTLSDIESNKSLMERIRKLKESHNHSIIRSETETIEVKGNIVQIKEIPNLNESTRYVLDAINHIPPSEIIVIDDNYISFTGWAIDKKNDALPGAVFIEIGDKIFQTHYGIQRDGVANTFGSQFLMSGFNVIIDSDLLEPGEYKVNVKVLNSGKTHFYKPMSSYNIKIID